MRKFSLLLLLPALLLVSCGDDDVEEQSNAAVVGELTAYCLVESLGTLTCTETRNTTQAVIDALQLTCGSEENGMSSGEGECANKSIAPGECRVVRDDRTTYIYQSGEIITAEMAKNSCENQEGDVTEFTPYED